MNAQELIEKVMQQPQYSTAASIAKALGTSHVSIHHWRAGTNAPRFEHALLLAELAGEKHPFKTAAKVRASAEKDRRTKAALLRMSGVAAAATLTLLLATPALTFAHNSGAVYIMSTLGTCLLALGTTLAWSGRHEKATLAVGIQPTNANL